MRPGLGGEGGWRTLWGGLEGDLLRVAVEVAMEMGWSSITAAPVLGDLGNAILPLLTLPAFCTAADPALGAPSSDTLPTVPSMDLPSSLLIFGVPVLVGLLLALAALWGFLACKLGKRRRKRRKAEQKAEGRRLCSHYWLLGEAQISYIFLGMPQRSSLSLLGIGQHERDSICSGSHVNWGTMLSTPQGVPSTL